MALYWGTRYIRSCLPQELADDMRSVETDPYIVMTPEQERSVHMINGKLEA